MLNSRVGEQWVHYQTKYRQSENSACFLNHGQATAFPFDYFSDLTGSNLAFSKAFRSRTNVSLLGLRPFSPSTCLCIVAAELDLGTGNFDFVLSSTCRH